MKKWVTLFFGILITVEIFGQVPQKMSYQCVIRNASGVLMTNQSVGIRISILQGTATGNTVYQETYNPNPQTNANGLLSIEIGGGLTISGAFTSIDWSQGPYFLKTEADPTGSTNYTIVGTVQLLSVPYALYAKTSGNGFSGNYFDLTNKPVLFSGNYNDLMNKPMYFDGTWTNITGKPTSLSGYGITDGMNTTHVANSITSTNITNWNTAYSWGNHSGLYKSISYVPTWNEITGKPALFDGNWANVTGKPTTLSGYGITDGMSTSHVANGITSTMISNWNTAFGWGNHAGLYRPIGYVPTWSEITSKPTTVSGYGITDAVANFGDQTIAGNKSFTGTISASSKNITNVGVPINDQDAATKAYVDALQEKLTMLDNTVKAGGPIKDIDGNSYNTLVLGTQTWMAQNLRTTRYNNGELIGTTPRYYNALGEATPKYQWDFFLNESNLIRGRLYTWYAVTDIRGVCPVGWHLPSDDEWKILEMYLGMTKEQADRTSSTMSDVGNKMKTTTGWFMDQNGTNSSGFSALATGIYNASTSFDGSGQQCYWFSSTEFDATSVYTRSLSYEGPDVGRPVYTKKFGLSVRCVKN
jgi:uncharacterized protein (TIGR02145 family)